MKRYAKLTCLLFCLLPTLSPPLNAQIKYETREEYEVKAHMLKRFANYIRWPKDNPVTEEGPFILTVIGRNPFLKRNYSKNDTGTCWLNWVYVQNKEKIKGKPVLIRYITDPEQIPGSHMLFIPTSERKNLNQILLVALKSRPLVVGDTSGYAQKGVHVNFLITHRNTTSYEINQKAALEGGFNIHFRMLKHAHKIINPLKKIQKDNQSNRPHFILGKNNRFEQPIPISGTYDVTYALSHDISHDITHNISHDISNDLTIVGGNGIGMALNLSQKETPE